MKRLHVLSAIALAAAVAAVATVPASGTTPHRTPGKPVGLAKVQHIVVVFQENHSFDNYFGTYPKALNPAGEPKFVAKPGTPSVHGFTPALRTHNPNAANPYRIDRRSAHTCSPKHSYTPEQQAADGGAMDQFVPALGPTKPGPDCLKKISMGFYDGNTVTAIWNYAQRFAMSDDTFGTTYGPSTVGALNLISGQTHGATPAALKGNVAHGTVIGDADPLYEDCSSAKNRVSLSGRNIGDLLTAHNVSWGWFEGGFKWTSHKPNGAAVCGLKHINSAGKVHNDYTPHHEPFQYYATTSNPHHVRPTSATDIGMNADAANHQYDISNFWAAADGGHLPAVSFLKAPSYQDGHPGSSDPLAEQTFLVNTLNRIQQLPEWSSTVVILAYDDSGGWYDHVFKSPVNGSNDAADVLDGARQCGPAPGPGAYLDRCGFGPRLPLLVISPWSKRNYVDSTLNDQTSILRLIEQRFSLGTIGDQSYDAIGTGTLLGMLDFAHPRTTPLLLNPTTGLPQ
jgi:phospholipase C